MGAAASFDSATTAARVTARWLAGQDSPVLGNAPEWPLRPVLAAANLLPKTARRWLYAAGSGREGHAADAVGHLDAAALSRQVVERYPRLRYPGAVVGSSPLSLTHLAALGGMPLLPQTTLVPVRRRTPLDEPRRDLDALRSTVARLLACNPDVAVHQMYDPVQDRLTLRWFSYLRIKRLTLGSVYEGFLLDTLAPGATLWLAESTATWPVTTVAERHLFQFGGFGAASAEEFHFGGPRVAEFLRRYDAGRTGWDPPPPDTEAPEAEWGFAPDLRADVERFAAEHGFGVRRLVFDQAEDASGLVADVYRQAYADRGLASDRLAVESFVLVDPWWVLRAGAVPFWLTFNGRRGHDLLAAYLRRAPRWRRADYTMIANGTRSIGLVGLQEWDALLRGHADEVRLAGVDPRRYPADLALFARYRDPLREGPRVALPDPLPAARLERMVAAAAPTSRVSLE